MLAVGWRRVAPARAPCRRRPVERWSGGAVELPAVIAKSLLREGKLGCVLPRSSHFRRGRVAGVSRAPFPVPLRTRPRLTQAAKGLQVCPCCWFWALLRSATAGARGSSRTHIASKGARRPGTDGLSRAQIRHAAPGEEGAASSVPRRNTALSWPAASISSARRRLCPTMPPALVPCVPLERFAYASPPTW